MGDPVIEWLEGVKVWTSPKFGKDGIGWLIEALIERRKGELPVCWLCDGVGWDKDADEPCEACQPEA